MYVPLLKIINSHHKYLLTIMKRSVTFLYAAMAGCLVGLAQTPVAAVAYIYPDYPESTRQIDFQYDQFNRVVAFKTTSPSAPGKYESGRNVYTDYKPGQYAMFQQYLKGPDATSETLNQRWRRLYDGNDNVVVEAAFNSPANVFYANLFDYSLLPQGVYLGKSNYNYDPSTYELLDSTNTQITTVYCPGAKRYFNLNIDSYSKMTVFEDHTVIEDYDRNNPDKLLRITWDYYADGESLYSLTKNFREPYDNPNDFYWTGYRKDVTETGDVRTTIDYSVDETSGEFVYTTKTEQYIGDEGPMHNSFTRIYYWQDNEWTLNTWDSYENIWVNKKVRKTIRNNKETLTLYNDNGKAEGTMQCVGKDLYVIAKEKKEEITWYYNYYTLEGKLLRQIKADYTYIWAPRFYEYTYGEWRFPTQDFIYFKDNIAYKINVAYSWDGFAGMEWGIMKNDVFNSIGSIGYSLTENGVPMYWDRYSGSSYNPPITKEGQGNVTKIKDGVYGILYWNDTRDRSKPKYFEYDVKRGIMNFYTEESNGQRVYSYSSFIGKFNSSYYINDSTYVEVRSTYDYYTDKMTTTRREYNNTIDIRSVYDFETEEWIKTSEIHTIKTLRPEWKKCTEPETPWMGVSNSTTYLSYSEANRILRGESAESKRMEDIDKLALTFDPATGEEISREHQYVIYEDTPQVCARHEIKEMVDGTTVTNSEVYELTSDGRPYHYYRSSESSSSLDPANINLERWWDYDTNGNLTQISGSNITTTRYAYGQSYDLINDYENGIHEVEYTMDDVPSIPVRYFNLQGIEIPNPKGGVFIRSHGSHTTKVLIP